MPFLPPKSSKLSTNILSDTAKMIEEFRVGELVLPSRSVPSHQLKPGFGDSSKKGHESFLVVLPPLEKALQGMTAGDENLGSRDEPRSSRRDSRPALRRFA